MTFGNTIATYRKKLGITQEALAQQLDVTNQAVSKWESDLSCPDVMLLPKLADIFQISIDVLFGREPETAPAPAPIYISDLPWRDNDTLYAVLYKGHQLIRTQELNTVLKNKEMTFRYDGPALNVDSCFSVKCGNVDGDVDAGGNVECGTVSGDVDAGGSVKCGTVSGDVDAGGKVTCGPMDGDVGGSVDAGTNVECGNVDGNVDAGLSVKCGTVSGDVDAGGSVECGAVSGDVDAGGKVMCGPVGGNVDAGGNVTIQNSESTD